MKNLNLEGVKMSNLFSGETYKIETKDCNFILQVTEKKSGHGSGKKTVIFGKLETVAKDGNNTTTLKEWKNNNDNKGGCDICTLQKYLNSDKKATPRGYKKAEKTESLDNVICQMLVLIKRINDLTTYEEKNDDLEVVYTRFKGLFFAINNMKHAQKTFDTANNETKNDLMEYIKNCKDPMELAQLFAMIQKPTTNE